MQAPVFAGARGDLVDVLARGDTEPVMGHVLLVLLTLRPAAEQHEDEIVLGTRAREPDNAAFALAVLLDDLQPAIALVEGDRLIEVRHMQRAVGERRDHRAGQASRTASSTRSRPPNTQ
jgi:hypothetical protein